MNFIKKHKKLTKVVSVIACILLVGYFLATLTMVRVYIVYAMLGNKANINTRLECIKSTNNKVSTKFQLPLDFDTKSKNELKEYWHYKYYVDCLYTNGYDYYGNKIEKSFIQNNEYTNNYVGINLNLPANTNFEISKDNEVNVDEDDRLYYSQLKDNNKTISVLVYKKNDDIQNLKQVKEDLDNLFVEVNRTVESENENYLIIKTDKEETGVIKRLSTGQIVFVYSKIKISAPKKTKYSSMY